MQEIAKNGVLLLLIPLIVAFWAWCIRVRVLHPLALIIDNRCYVFRGPLGHPLGKWTTLIFGQPSKVSLADGDEIVVVPKCDLRKRLTTVEFELVQQRLRSCEKICVVRNHELREHFMKWLADLTGYALVDCPSASRKDDIVVSAI